MIQLEPIYIDPTDNSEFKVQEIELNMRPLAIASGTIVGNGEGRMNEDSFADFLAENSIFLAVFDGITSLKPIAGLPVTGARFASHFLKKNFQPSAQQSPKEIMAQLNRLLLTESLKLGASLEDTHTLPASGGTIVKLDLTANTLEFAHVMDTWLLVYYKDGTSQLVTNNLNDQFDAPILALMQKVAEEKNITAREARKDPAVESALLEMFSKRNNNPDGSGCGVINGDSNLEQYIQTGTIELESVMAILMGTDGLLPPGMSFVSTDDREQLLRVIINGGLEELMALKKNQEDADPDYQAHIRYKHSDDATGIFIQLL